MHWYGYKIILNKHDSTLTNSLKRPFLSVSSDVFLEITVGREELVTAVINAIERVSIVKPLMSSQPKNNLNSVKGI